KSFEYRAKYPSGETETLLSVPHYSFNWQLTYELAQPKLLPQGTVIECTAHYDNSINNPLNPDATKEVRYGEQSWDEMMFGFFDVAIPMDEKPADLLRAPKKTAAD
ncbi:MAG: thiol-disulfide isomerase, partial [Bryobacteraceae bacterium]